MFRKILILSILLSLIACNNSLTTKEKQQYIKKGKEITKASFSELSSNLMQQMKIGGSEQAIPFCNTQAMPITKRMEDKFNVTIKRTSDKLRNSENKPSKRELEIISDYESELKNNKELIPVVEINMDKNVQFYAPIIIDSKCMTCHGKLGEGLNVKTDSLIKTLYPKDLAKGYKEGDLRGIWSVEFNK